MPRSSGQALDDYPVDAGAHARGFSPCLQGSCSKLQQQAAIQLPCSTACGHPFPAVVLVQSKQLARTVAVRWAFNIGMQPAAGAASVSEIETKKMPMAMPCLCNPNV
jgi:hypothetical protein